MLFLLKCQARPNLAEDWQKRSLQVFSKWKPPMGKPVLPDFRQWGRRDCKAHSVAP